MSGKKSGIVNRRWQTLSKPANLIRKDPTRQAWCLLKHLVKQPTKYLSVRKRQSSSSPGQKALNPAIPGHLHRGEGTIYSSQFFLEDLLSKRCLNPIPALLARQVKRSQTLRQPGTWLLNTGFQLCPTRRGHLLGHKKKKKVRMAANSHPCTAVSIHLQCSAHHPPALVSVLRLHSAGGITVKFSLEE